MSPLAILLTIIAYFVLLFAVSYAAGRNTDNKGFFSANKQSKWWLVAISTIGAAISGVTFVSVPGMVGQSAFSYMQMVLGFAVGQFIIAYVLIPLYYKLNVTSIYEYLQQRFGIATYKTGAWFFFVSKMLGASVRLYVVSSVLQLLVFTPLNVPFVFNVVVTVGIVYLCTFKGGVKSVIWIDVVKTICMLLSVICCIWFILRSNISLSGFGDSAMSRVFFFDDFTDNRYFWKQFLAGVFLVIATTGLDQDLMQRTLSCKTYSDAQKNMVVGATMQIFVIYLFLLLGWLLYSFATENSIDISSFKGDDIFAYLATGGYFPAVVGVFFIVGFIASAYSAAGSALTALTTSFTIDILQDSASAGEASKNRHRVHILMAVLMAICIYVIGILNDDSVIQTVYKVASYTYGPLLGMFCFGLFTKRKIKGRWMPVVAILAPILTWIIDANSVAWFGGYQFSHERLLLNAVFTVGGMLLISKRI